MSVKNLVSLGVSVVNACRKKKTSILFGLTLAVLLGVYLAFPDKVFDFDGVYYGYAIDGQVQNLRSRIFDAHHPLFLPALMLLHDALIAAGHRISGYDLIQRVNACAGVFGLWLYRRLLARITHDTAVSIVAALLLGVSFSYWCRATEGQTYMLMTLGALAVYSSAVTLVERPSARRAGALVVLWLVSVFFHVANAALFPAVAAAFWLAAPANRRFRVQIAMLAIVIAAVLLGCWMLGIHGSNALAVHMKDELATVVNIGRSGRHRLLLFFSGYSSAFIAGGADDARHGAIGALVYAGVGAATVAFWSRQSVSQRRAAAVVLCGGLATALLSFTSGLWHYVAPPTTAVLIAFAALSWSRSLKEASPFARRLQLSLAAVAVLVLGGWNGWAGIRPRSRLEDNDGYARARFVGEHTVATSWVLISGLGFMSSKVFITQFSRRSNRALEYFLRANPKAQALALFGAFVQDAVAHGIPVYMLSDLVDDPVAAEEIRKQWGATPEEVRSCFGRGEFLLIASYDPGLRLYLFVPQRRRPALFAGLAFNILDMGLVQSTQEAGAVLRRLAAEMTPDERLQTAALLRSTRYGALLTFSGMAPYLDDATRPRAEAYVRGFMQSPTAQSIQIMNALNALLGNAPKEH
jgi:hypothetical protein